MTDGRMHFFPPLRMPTVQRDRLVATARDEDATIIVFNGPLGSGKSIAARQTAASFAADGDDCVWVSLTEQDRDFDAFWRHVLRAVTAKNDARTAADANVEHLLDLSSPASIVDALQKEAPADGGLVLVLDDVHHLSEKTLVRSIHDVLLRTERIRMIGTSRFTRYGTLDLTLRASVPICVVGDRELAFTEAETRALVEHHLAPSATLDFDAIVGAVQRSTFGWPVAAHAMTVDRRFASSGRPGTTPRGFAAEFVDRLLVALPERHRPALWMSTLLQTTSASLLAQALNVPEAGAEQFFAVADDVAFRVHEDAAGTRWYRHHPALRDEFQRRSRDFSRRAENREALQRAAQTLRGDRPRQAAALALAARDWPLLNDIISSVPIHTLIAHRGLGVDRFSDIPDGVLRRHPALAALALTEEQQASNGLSPRLLRNARAAAGSPHRTDDAAVLQLDMIAARLCGDEDAGLRAAKRLEGMRRAVQPRSDLDGVDDAQIALTFLRANRFEQASLVLDRPSMTPSAGNRRYRAHRLALSALSCALRGDIADAERLLAECAAQGHWAEQEESYRLTAVIVALESGRWDEAHLATVSESLDRRRWTDEYASRLIELRTTMHELRFGAASALLWLEAQLDRHDKERASSFRSEQFDLTARRQRLIWQAGRIAPERPRSSALTRTAVYSLLSRQRLADARTMLDGMKSEPAIFSYPRRGSEILLLHAWVAAKMDDRKAASTSARLAARLLDDCRMTLPYRTLSTPALTVLQKLAPGIRSEHGYPIESAAPETIQLLSPSELRSLAAVVEYGTTSAAGEALFLSRHTIRQQLKSAYRKLGVSSRDEAIRISRELGLIQLASS